MPPAPARAVIDSSASASWPPAGSRSAQILESDAPAEAYREIYAVLDDEIVESLASGGPFASLAFLQDRLDSFADAWGGASLRLVRSRWAAGGRLHARRALGRQQRARLRARWAPMGRRC